MVEHVNIVDSQRHEPKGADAASSGEVYISDGATSGAWDKLSADVVTVADADALYTATNVETVLKEIRDQDPTGWCQYGDSVYSSTGSTELDILSSGSGTQLTNNKSTVIETNAPRDMTTTLWDSGTNTFTPINENDYYVVRWTFEASTVSGTVNFITLNLDIGGTPGVIWSSSFIPDKPGSGQVFAFTIPVFTGSTFNANGGTFYLLKDGTGTFKIQDLNLSIARIHRGR